jgi:hypothetical protein
MVPVRKVQRADEVTGCKAADSRPDANDFTGPVRERNERRRDPDMVVAARHGDVTIVECGRPHSDDDVVRTRLGIWPFHEAQ